MPTLAPHCLIRKSLVLSLTLKPLATTIQLLLCTVFNTLMSQNKLLPASQEYCTPSGLVVSAQLPPQPGIVFDQIHPQLTLYVLLTINSEAFFCKMAAYCFMPLFPQFSLCLESSLWMHSDVISLFVCYVSSF